jgi:hypothetical protein
VTARKSWWTCCTWWSCCVWRICWTWSSLRMGQKVKGSEYKVSVTYPWHSKKSITIRNPNFCDCCGAGNSTQQNSIHSSCIGVAGGRRGSAASIEFDPHHWGHATSLAGPMLLEEDLNQPPKRSLCLQRSFETSGSGNGWKEWASQAMFARYLNKSVDNKQQWEIYTSIWLYGGFLKWGTPKSSILMGFSIINQPSWDTPILLKPPYIYIIYIYNISYHEYDDKHRVKRLNSQCMLSEANYSN